MGASGLRLCFFCRNVIKAASGLVEADETGWFVDHCEEDPSKFKLQTNAGLWATARDLTQKSTELSKAAFASRQTSLGMRYSPEGVLFDPTLREVVFPISWTSYDWMHNYLVGGVFQVEVNLLLKELKTERVECSHVRPRSKTFTHAAVALSL